MAARTTRTRRRNSTVRKPKNRRRINWRKVGLQMLVVLIAAGITAGVAWMLNTPRLAITKIAVHGNHITDEKDIKTLAQGIIGKNIFAANTHITEKSVLKRPEIEKVKISRRLPGTVIVKVTERRPAAVVKASDGFYEIDSSRIIFRKVATPNPSIPMVLPPHPIKVRPGKPANDKSVATAMNCLQLCRETNYRVSKLSVDSSGNVCLNMGSGFYVKLGQAEQVAEKLAIVRTTLRARPEIGREALYIDVSCPTAPAWKPKNEDRKV